MHLDHREAARLWPARKGRIERCDIVIAQAEIAGRGILGRMLGATCFGNREYLISAGEKAKRNLARGCMMGTGDLLQHFAGPGTRRREIIVAERRIGDHGDAVTFAPREHRVLDGALLQREVSTFRIRPALVSSSMMPCM